MGVFHIAIPFPGAACPLPPVRRQPPTPPDFEPSATHTSTGPRTSSDHLAPRPAKARIQRTPEQQDEHQALTLLVAQCLAGDQSAWHRMVTSQHKRVYGICYRFTGDASAAEDVTQDVFLKVYRNLSTFDGEKGGFHTWITTLTRNLLVDNYRRTRLDRASDSLDVSLSADDDGPTQAERLADPRPDQAQHYAGLELKARIQDALSKISPDLREAVILRDLEDMDYKEIALVLKIPEGTVKSRICRGRGELARLLQRIEGKVI